MFNALKTNESFKMHKDVKMNMKTNHTKNYQYENCDQGWQMGGLGHKWVG